MTLEATELRIVDHFEGTQSDFNDLINRQTSQLTIFQHADKQRKYTAESVATMA